MLPTYLTVLHRFLLIISWGYAAIILSSGCLFSHSAVRATCELKRDLTVDTLMLDFYYLLYLHPVFRGVFRF